ncbi:MAG: endolytic transglycosylase MltG [Pseudomonadales bacterium]|nr:endolytic transglycosylase MltG [Pseudomonadales bacterium]MDA0762683.1 endolytic transglycosylase MltG [Pseudomonadota bacterium]MDA0957587.1 endolytic transglycosylase MltG [Pseudomonadota bacterium]
MNRITTVVLCLSFGITIVALLCLSSVYGSALGLKQPEYLRVPTGGNLTTIAAELTRRGIWQQPVWLLKGLDRLFSNGEPVLAGEYQLLPEQTLAELLQMLRRGDVYYRSVTFPEGLTVMQWRSRLYAQEGLRAISRRLSSEALAEAIIGRAVSLEGWLHPETYHYTWGDTDIDVLRYAHQSMIKVVDKAWRATEHPTLETIDELIILASIVERESGNYEDQKKIARVFLNRLEQDMRLQSDPTIIYGLGEAFDGDLTRRHLREDGPYNSYRRKGLPPTAICNPGQGAIQAVMNPAEGKWLYFVARGDGSSEFSNTLIAHERAVDKFQRNKNPVVN